MRSKAVLTTDTIPYAWDKVLYQSKNSFNYFIIVSYFLHIKEKNIAKDVLGGFLQSTPQNVCEAEVFHDQTFSPELMSTYLLTVSGKNVWASGRLWRRSFYATLKPLSRPYFHNYNHHFIPPEARKRSAVNDTRSRGLL